MKKMKRSMMNSMNKFREFVGKKFEKVKVKMASYLYEKLQRVKMLIMTLH